MCSSSFDVARSFSELRSDIQVSATCKSERASECVIFGTVFASKVTMADTR